MSLMYPHANLALLSICRVSLQTCTRKRKPPGKILDLNSAPGSVQAR